MLHGQAAVFFQLVTLSVGELGLTELVGPFALDEKRPWHGSLITEGVKKKTRNPAEKECEKSALSCLF